MIPSPARRFLRFAVFFIICATALLEPAPLRSQEETGPEAAPSNINSVITSIEIIGLKRTSPGIARYPLEKFLGRDGAELDFNEVYAAVKDTNILEPNLVELVETTEGLLLRVTVTEKWSIFPVPVVMASSGDYSAGLFLADTNALGLMDMAALGAMYSSSGWMAMLMYRHTPRRNGFLGWNTFFMYNQREREDEDRDEKIYRRYSSDQLRFSFGLSYPFATYFTAGTALSFTDISLKKNSKAFNTPAEGARHLALTPDFSFSYSIWDGYLLSQRSVTLGYSYNLALSGSSYHQLEFRGACELPLVPGFRINLRSGAIWKSEAGSDTAPLFEEGPASAQVDILPKKFAAMRYAGISAGLEKYIFKSRWGTFSVLGSWQCVTSYGPISGMEFDNGPSGGVRFYLSRLALPALGAMFAYNMNSGRSQFAFNMGMAF